MKKNNENQRRAPRSLRAFFSTLEKSEKPIDVLISQTMTQWYEAKHPNVSSWEVSLVNSLKVSCCPYCKSEVFVRSGKGRSGFQRFLCKSCHRRFESLTGTVFDSKKIPLSEWIEYLIHLFQLQSVTLSSIDNENAYSTGRYWLKKVFEVLKDYQDGLTLGNRFWIDETYLKLMPKDLVRDENGKLLRGLSRNNCCILSARGKDCVMVFKGFGKPSKKKVFEGIGRYIKDEACMIDDGEKSHSVLVERFHLKREIHTTKETRGLIDKDNPMEPINYVHALFKRFMRAHGGYLREELQDWCNLFCFIFNHHGDMPMMVKDFLQIAISTKKIMRYRVVMRKTPING